MKAKSLVYVSGSLNLVLVILLLARSEGDSDDAGRGPKWSPQEADLSLSEGPLSAAPLAEGAEEIVPQLPTFRWSQIESEDYAKYIKNLRSVGCPESTIADILEADINQLYQPRYLSLLSDVQSFDFWRKGPEDLENQESIREAIAVLDTEREGFLESLLGDSYTPSKAMAVLSDEELLERSKLGFLDSSVQGAVVAINAEFDDLERQLRLENSGLGERAQLNRLLAENRSERREALAAVMSSDELLELELRDSHAASALRNKLRGFEVSESEFREMFSRRQAYELEHGEVPDYSSRERMEERNLARQELESFYQKTLGGDRYTDLQRQGDASWEALKRLEESKGISRNLMNQAYDLRRQASASLMNSRANQDLDEVERLALSEAARGQYQREMTALLGEDGFEALGGLQQSPSISVFTGAGGAQTPLMILGGSDASTTLVPGAIRSTFFSDGGDVRVESVTIATEQSSPVLLESAPAGGQ